VLVVSVRYYSFTLRQTALIGEDRRGHTWVGNLEVFPILVYLLETFEEVDFEGHHTLLHLIELERIDRTFRAITLGGLCLTLSRSDLL
jgi:hypothetical protein